MKKASYFLVALLLAGAPAPAMAAMDWWKGVMIQSVGYYPYGGYWTLRVKIDAIPTGKSGTFACAKTTNELYLATWEGSPNQTVTTIRHSALLAALATERPVDLYVDNGTCSSEAGLLIQGVVVN